MRSIKAVYENGHLVFPEGDGPEGRMEVVVVFPDKNQTDHNQAKGSGERFVREWSGILEGCDLGNWQENKADDLKETPSENPS